MDNKELIEKMIKIAEMVRNLGESDRAWRLIWAAIDVALVEIRELERDGAIWRRTCAALESEIQATVDRKVMREER